MDYNFVVKNRNYDEITCRGLFGNEEVTEIDAGLSMADILVKVGIYPSKSRATADGWNYALDFGFKEYTIGKKHTRIFIWNPLP